MELFNLTSLCVRFSHCHIDTARHLSPSPDGAGYPFPAGYVRPVFFRRDLFNPLMSTGRKTGKKGEGGEKCGGRRARGDISRGKKDLKW